MTLSHTSCVSLVLQKKMYTYPDSFSGLFFLIYINCNPYLGLEAVLLAAVQNRVVMTVFQLS